MSRRNVTTKQVETLRSEYRRVTGHTATRSNAWRFARWLFDNTMDAAQVELMIDRARAIAEPDEHPELPDPGPVDSEDVI